MSEKIHALAGLVSERLGERAASLLIASGEITLVPADRCSSSSSTAAAPPASEPIGRSWKKRANSR